MLEPSTPCDLPFRNKIFDYIMNSLASPHLSRCSAKNWRPTRTVFRHVFSYGYGAPNGALGIHPGDSIRSLHLHRICDAPHDFQGRLEEGPGPEMESKRLSYHVLHVFPSGENIYDPCGSGMGNKQCARALQALSYFH
jgi:hypothetical protein